MCNKKCETCKHLIHLINDKKEHNGYECDKYEKIVFSKDLKDLKKEVLKC